MSSCGGGRGWHHPSDEAMPRFTTHTQAMTRTRKHGRQVVKLLQLEPPHHAPFAFPSEDVGQLDEQLGLRDELLGKGSSQCTHRTHSQRPRHAGARTSTTCVRRWLSDAAMAAAPYTTACSPKMMSLPGAEASSVKVSAIMSPGSCGHDAGQPATPSLPKHEAVVGLCATRRTVHVTLMLIGRHNHITNPPLGAAPAAGARRRQTRDLRRAASNPLGARLLPHGRPATLRDACQRRRDQHWRRGAGGV